MASPLYNPFDAERSRSRVTDNDPLSTGARSMVNDMFRSEAAAARRDPADDEIKALNERKTNIRYQREDLKNQLHTFLTKDGSDLFESDPLSGKPIKNPDGTYVPKLGAEVESLRARTQQKTGLIAGALSPTKQAGDPTDDAVAAQSRLDQIEPIYQLKQQKFDRFQAEKQRLDTEEQRHEQRLGDLARQREAKYSVTGDDVASAISSVNASRAAMGQQPVSAEDVAPKVRPSQRPETQALLDSVYPKEVFSTLTDPQTQAPIGRAIAPEAVNMKVRQEAAQRKLDPVGAETVELSNLRDQGVTHVGNQSVADMLAERGGDEAVASVRTMETVKKIDSRLSQIDGDLENAGDKMRGKLERERAVLGKLREQKQGLIDAIPTGDRIKNALGSMISGLADIPASTLDALAITAKKLDDVLPSALQEHVGEKVADHNWSIAAKYIRDFAQSVAPTQDRLASEFWSTQVPQGIGSMLGFLGAGVAGNAMKVPSYFAPLILGAATGGAQGYKDALDHGATEDQAFTSFLLNAGVGTSEVVPISAMLDRLDKGSGGTIKKALIHAGKEGFEETLQEFFQSAAGNAIAQSLYDKNRDLFDGAGDSAAVGGVTGILTSLVVSALGGHQHGGHNATGGNPAAPSAPTTPKSPIQPEGGGINGAQEEGQGLPVKGATPEATPSEASNRAPTATPAANTDEDTVTLDDQAPKSFEFTNTKGDTTIVEAVRESQAIARLPDEFGPIKGVKRVERPEEKLAGEKISPEWTEFSPESKSLGIPRAEMPQVKAEHRGALTQFLKARDIMSEETEVRPSELKPTQAEFSPGKVQKARDFKGGDRAILVSSDNHVVDGHHQWMAKLTDAPDEFMRVIKLDAPIRDVLAQMKEFPSVENAGGATSAKPITPGSDKPIQAVRGSGEEKAVDSPAPVSPEPKVSKPDKITPPAGDAPAAPALKAPVVERGKNKPAEFIRAVAKASGLKAKDKATKFLTDFAPRLHKANPKAFQNMEVHVLNQAEWNAHPRTGTYTPDSSAAYNPGDNTLYLNADKMRGNDGVDAISAIVHESGHFAEQFALGEAMTQREWEKISHDQRREAWKEYSGDDYSGDAVALLKDRRARAEWVAMQFSRVVRGETDAMPKTVAEKLKGYLETVRELVRKWVGGKSLTTQELDSWILDKLGYAKSGEPKAPVSGENAAATDPDSFEARYDNPKVKVSVRDIVAHVAKSGDVDSYARSLGFKDVDRNLTMQERRFLIDQLDRAAKAPTNTGETSGGVSPELKALGDALFGAPATEGHKQKFDPEKIETANKFVALLVREKPDVRSRATLAKLITDNFPKAKPYSESIFRIMSGFADVDENGTFDEAYATPAAIDNPAPAANTSTDERNGSERGNVDAGERNAGAAEQRAQESEARRASSESGIPTAVVESGSGAGTGAESIAGQPGIERSGGSGGDDAGSSGRTVVKSDTGGEVQPAAGGETPVTNEPSGKRSRTVAEPVRAELKPEDRNHAIGPNDVLIPGGDKTKARTNVAALKLLKQLEEQKRNATPEEKKILAQYVGWGGIPAVFDEYKSRYNDPEWRKEWGKVHDDLKALLTKEEWAAAARSTINAHYTSRDVIAPMWDIARRLGFKGGVALETSMGAGHFLGLEPNDLAAKTKWRGVELDNVSGRIAQKLYPQAQIQVTGFQDAKIANHSVDLVIGNFPFAKDGPMDDRYPRLSLHNYFFARSMDALKPGGLMVAITSSSTMDGGSSRAAREWLAERADLVGAIRLPNTAFKKNAGTEVTTDIVILRKRGGGAFNEAQNWLNTQTISTYDGKGEVPVNEYFARNPEMMLGRMSLEGTMYRDNEPALLPKPGQDLSADIAAALDKLPANIANGSTVKVGEDTSPTSVGEQAAGKEGSVIVKDGKPYQIEQGVLKAPAWATSATKAPLAKSFVGVRDSVKSLISLMASEGSSDGAIEAARADLNKEYDKHVKRFGPLNGRTHAFLEEDPELPLVQALEDVASVAKEITVQSGKNAGQKRQTFEKEYRKATIFSKRTIFPRAEPTSADTTRDAISQSLAYRNGIDVGYVASLRGITTEQAEQQLAAEPNVFRDPKSGSYQTEDAYLSGFVREKLEQAKKAAESDEAYAKNVAALEKAQPEWLPIESISYRLGSSWLPPKLIQEFLRDKLQVGAGVTFVPQTGHWKLSPHSGYQGAVNVTTFGTTRLAGHEMVEDALNLKTPVVYDEISTPEGTKREKNQNETLLAQQKQSEIKDLFRAYVAEKADVHPELEKIYNDRFNGVKLREFKGPTWEHYPNASSEVKLRQHQKDVTARILQESTLLAHSVGTGKTFIMITAAMEMRRLGVAKKPMIVTQNATTQQFAASHKRLYPTAKILVPTRKQREAANRKKLMSQIATGDYDTIIIPQSFLNQLPDNPERLKGFIQQEIDELETARFEAARSEGGKSPRVKDLEKAKARLEERLKKLADRKTDDTVTFEQLGVDALFVDEAHAYKKLEFTTQMDNIKGLDRGASERGLGLYMKTRWIQEKNNGKNVVLATGTPVSNTIAEAWNMLRFTRPDLLEKYGVERFDDFASTFGDTVTNIEQTAGGQFKQVTRFAKYTNGPELIALFHSAADVVLKEDINLPGLPAMKNGQPTTVQIKQTPALAEYIKVLRARLEAFEKMSGREKRDNSHIPLVTFGDAKKATLDLRLIDSSMPDEAGSKMHRVVDEVLRVYKESNDTKGTQLVFADLFQSPDGKFNLYQAMRDELVQKGIPADAIAIINEAKNDAQRERMFEGVKSGAIRVMFGSTEKMGVGVNVQDKLIALHHMDAPARPMDIEQRNGRIVRQGNENPIVEVLNYGVENTLDATLYQRLAIKQKFINQIMRGDITGRSFEDAADEVSMTFEEQMAAFSGNPLAMKKVGVEGEVRRLEALKQGHIRQLAQTRGKLVSAKSDLASKETYQPKIEKAAARADELFSEDMNGKVEGKSYADRKTLVAALDSYLADFLTKQKDEIGAQISSDNWQFPAGSVEVHGMPIQLRLVVPTNQHGLIGEGASEPRYQWETLMEGGIRLSGSATTGGGLLLSLTHDAKALKVRAADNLASIARVQRDITEMSGFVEQPFQQEQQLSKAKEEAAQIERELAAPPATPPTPESSAAAPTDVSDATLGAPPVRGTPEQEKILSKVNGTLEDKRSLMVRMRDYLADLKDYVSRELKQKLLDQFASIKRLERGAFGAAANLDASVSAYKAARLTKNLPSVMDYLMNHGRLEYRNGSMSMGPGKGLMQVFKPLIDNGTLRLWEGYATAVRADRLLQEGKETNFGRTFDPVTGKWAWDKATARKEIDELLKLGTRHPEFETVRKEYVGFQQSILDVAENAGLINAKQRATWEKSDYVPFYRITESLDGKGPRKRRGIADQRSGIRQLKGAGAPVAIMENIVRNVEQMVDASFKNIAMQRVADLASGNTDMLVRIPYKVVPLKASVTEVLGELEKAGIDTSGLSTDEAEEFVNFWRARAPKGKDVVSVMVDGKPIYYRVKDAPLLRSVQSMGPRAHSWWMNALMAPKHLLTSAVTLDPAFMAANTIRDSFSAWVIADTPIRPGIDSAIGFVKSLRNDPSKLAIMAAGGGSGHYNNLREGRVRDYIRSLTPAQRKTFLESIVDSPKKMARLYADFGRATENANRIAIADSVKKRGGSDAEAAYQALDIMDFGLRGDSTALNFFLDTVPFLNARIQGLYRLGRGLKEDPKRVATHGAIIMGATLALLAANWDDDRYWDLPEWERDIYYHFWLGDQHVRIPKPFEVGQIFSTIPERLFEFVGKTGDGKLLGKRMLSMIGDTFAMNPLPQAAKPLAERAMNMNTFTQRPIVSRGDEYKQPEQQYNAMTSETIREIALAMPDSAPAWMRSPKTLEHFVRGYFGSLGMYALTGADAITRAATNAPPEPEVKAGDWWVMKRFAPSSDMRETKYVEQFYSLHNEVSGLVRQIKELQKTSPEDARKLQADNIDLVRYAPQAEAAYKTISALRKQEQRVHDSAETPEEKRQRLADLATRRNNIAANVMRGSPRRPSPVFNPFR